MDLLCNVCGDKPPEKNRKTCSACRKRLQRKGEVEKISVPTMMIVSEKPDSKNISVSHKGHWIGKAPHKPLWTSCEAKACPHMNAPEPDWEVTCDKVCCIDNAKQ